MRADDTSVIFVITRTARVDWL